MRLKNVYLTYSILSAKIPIGGALRLNNVPWD